MNHAASRSGPTLPKVISFLSLTLVAVLLTSCTAKPIVGWWKAEDETIFHFRDDGSFVGKDYKGRPIWGHWAELGEGKYGFQSLFHMGSYDPQYAVVTGPETMKYAGSAAVVFIAAKRIGEAEGAEEVRAVVNSMPTTNQRHRPE